MFLESPEVSKEVRKRLNKIAQDLEEDVQDFVPRWLRERLEHEEKKLQVAASKRGVKQKDGEVQHMVCIAQTGLRNSL